MVTTRTRNYEGTENEGEDQAPAADSVYLLLHLPLPQETLAEKRLRWSALLHSHQYHTVITSVLAEELPKYTHSTVMPTSLSLIMRECVLILASAPLIFTAAVDGVLASKILNSEDLQIEYEHVQSRANIQPSIYIHLLTDSHGVAPSANQYMLIRSMLLKYIDDEDFDPRLAHLIDNTSSPTIPLSSTLQGYRKYLHTRHRSPHRISTLRRLCAGIQARYDETPAAARTIPFAHPPGECGYALNSHKRLLQHRRRHSSNYVMNLVEDICAYLHLQSPGVFPKFHMHQFIIYLIFRPQQVRIAEMFTSGLLQVWVENGGGFNAHPAGLNTTSARRVTREEWEVHESFARGEGRLDENLRRQREVVEAVAQGLGDEVGEAWRRAVESEGQGDGNVDYEYNLSVHRRDA